MVQLGSHLVWLQSSWNQPFSIHTTDLSQLSQDREVLVNILDSADGDKWTRDIAPLLVPPSVISYQSSDGEFEIHAQTNAATRA